MSDTRPSCPASPASVPRPAGARAPRLPRTALVWWGSVVLLLLIMAASLVTGRYHISAHDVVQILLSRVVDVPHDWKAGADNVLFTVRLPRLFAAALVGAALSISGATFQGVFRNPLVSPDLLGVSQGASAGAAGAILLGSGTAGIQGLALGGGLLAVATATGVPRLLRNDSTLMLVLSGVIVSGFGAALVGLEKFVADPETQLASITYWQMGSLADVRSPGVTEMAVLALPCLIGLILLRWRVNILSLGDIEAQTLGLNLRHERGIAVLLATVLTASSVCLSGTVAWVGLVVPHLCRLVVGEDNTRVIPLSVTVGAGFMVLVDTLARCLSEAEIPLSVITGFIGAPLYLILLVAGRVRIR